MRACWREVRLSSFLKREHCRTIEGLRFHNHFRFAHLVPCARLVRIGQVPHGHFKKLTATPTGLQSSDTALHRASQEVQYGVLLQSNAAAVLNSSTYLCRLADGDSSRFRAKRVSERNGCADNPRSRPRRMAAGLFCIDASPLHQLPYRHRLSAAGR